jgi:non-lysosomal glucosylceramidase
VECITSVRARYDGERRNPWDEPECGSHYARAMSSWSGVLALNGFRCDGPGRVVTALPRLPVSNFRSFWSTATAWGTFAYGPGGQSLRLKVLHGQLSCRALIAVDRTGGATRVTLDGQELPHAVKRIERGVREVTLESEAMIRDGQELMLS